MMPPPAAPRPDAVVAHRDGARARSRDGHGRRARAQPRAGVRSSASIAPSTRAAVRDLLGLDIDVSAYLPAGHDERRLRQRRRRADVLAAADAGLSARRQSDQPARRRRSQRQRHVGHLQDRAQPIADGAGPRARRSARAAGTSVVHVFPADGDYVIKTALHYAALGGLFGRTPLMAHGLQGAGGGVGQRRARGAARRQPDDDRDRLRPEQGPERHGAAHAADAHQGGPAARDGGVHPAARRPGGRPDGAHREHGRGRRRLRLDDAAAHARHDHPRADQRHGRVRDGEPAPHLHVPPGHGRSGRGVRGARSSRS